mmetsp:Transcript_20815/g.29013  ORF Transcript_20815/g.29013 Transcript_20815/m.29013 type:complete len:83 (+) Transcript_20815:362-610(+)
MFCAHAIEVVALRIKKLTVKYAHAMYRDGHSAETRERPGVIVVEGQFLDDGHLGRILQGGCTRFGQVSAKIHGFVGHARSIC